mmetsp:Transcript_45568/g.113178  ORF Transcript_45568/g.113178 Transcript_45568/m.113178 type:complete len:278 (+) Transcript_45568:2155-2988(+)
MPRREEGQGLVDHQTVGHLVTGSHEEVQQVPRAFPFLGRCVGAVLPPRVDLCLHFAVYLLHDGGDAPGVLVGNVVPQGTDNLPSDEVEDGVEHLAPCAMHPLHVEARRKRTGNDDPHRQRIEVLFGADGAVVLAGLDLVLHVVGILHGDVHHRVKHGLEGREVEHRCDQLPLPCPQLALTHHQRVFADELFRPRVGRLAECLCVVEDLGKGLGVAEGHDAVAIEVRTHVDDSLELSRLVRVSELVDEGLLALLLVKCVPHRHPLLPPRQLPVLAAHP